MEPDDGAEREPAKLIVGSVVSATRATRPTLEVRMGELADTARRVAVELTSSTALTVDTARGAAVLAETDSLIASASVTPSATASTEALIAEAREVVAELRELLAAQQQRNPRWFETPAAATAVAVLSLLVALLAFAGDRWDAAQDDGQSAPTSTVAPSAVPEQGGPSDGR